MWGRRPRYLVTGGAGYIGSHLVLALCEQGADVVVYDNLSLGHRAAIPSSVRLVHADLADDLTLQQVLSDGPWDAVFHFASLSQVGESFADPSRYLMENSVNGLKLVVACIRHGIRRFVLSSTANLYGNPKTIPIEETSTIQPSAPYGDTKYMIERALHWADQVHGMRSACLRYFNAAGADPLGRLGEDHTPESHLIPLTIDTALRRRGELSVFGTDYPTPDGTCIRDYVHVSDLANAHIAVLDNLKTRSVTYNIGNGCGYSVKDVIASVERVSGRTVPSQICDRRAGDPAILVASSAKLRRETGWTPQLPELDDIVSTAFQWRQANPFGYDLVVPDACRHFDPDHLAATGYVDPLGAAAGV